MCDTRTRRTAPAIQEKLAIYENVLSVSALSATSGVSLGPLVPESVPGADEMVQEGEGAADGLIAPRRLPNPCLESPQRMDLHRELLFNQRIGKNVLNQKSELQKALSKHKEKQILNQVREHRETPELERAIAERARRLEQAEQSGEEAEPGTSPALQQIRARLRHAAPAPAASAH
ncbi:protein FAM107B isoform X1 [Ostrinia furnacalis]|uniref:protein FAM107B isoform X1 n=2 Tax=Ostrinia furnacalis TaxID=93504 RepID=UPI00103BB0DC|nr:protein FAM107B isoform X1 [Ostrinia furnacalis]XP_028171082.1 protein FAM107B isoform X1 [Ostrinia furnacalis]